MPFTICAIGCGWMATTGHGPSFAHYAAQTPDTCLAACCDLDAEKADIFAKKFGFLRSYTDYEEMLEREKPDAVSLVVPVRATASMACALLRAHIPVIMEKPPGLDHEETMSIIETAKQSRTPHQVAFNRRFMPLVRQMRDFMNQESPRYLQYDFYRYNRTDADFSTTAIHGIDTTRFLKGCPFQEAEITYLPQPGYPDRVCNILVDVRFQDQTTARITFCPVSGMLLERCTAHLQDAAILGRFPVWGSCDLPGDVSRYDKGVLTHRISTPEGTEGFIANGFFGENASFFNDIRANRYPIADAASGLQTVELADAIRTRKSHYSW